MSVRRLLPMILINVVVSALVVLAILFWWDGRFSPEPTDEVSSETAVSVTATVVIATAQAIDAAAATEAPPVPTDGPKTHVVSAGETLGSISTFYDVPLDDIMTANDITNPNIIAVGQQLVIPIGGLVVETAVPPTETPTSNEPPTPIPTTPADTGEVVIEMARVQNAGQLDGEAVQLVNNGSRQVGLQGWKLSDANGFVYTFGQVTVFGEGAGVLLHSKTGQDSATDLYWGLAAPVWESGERGTLVDPEGTIQATFVVP
jgi:LysM repeat protein